MKGLQRKDLNITFASFGEPVGCSAVKDFFVRSGYMISEPNDHSWYLDNSDNSKVLVLYIKNNDAPRNEIISLLKNKPADIPCFGVIQASGIQLDTEILSYCCEFVVWPCDQKELFFRLHSLVAERLARKEGLKNSFSATSPHIIGEAEVFKQVLKRIQVFSKCDAPVLIEGETGTGKEMIARAIHYYSERRGHPFIPVNCGALPDNLIENELFGHEKGAYTDAKSSSKGLVGQAEGGTLFLDEVESLSSKGQVALLRLLQEHEYKPLGSSKPIKANIRIVTASNMNLKLLSQKEILRKDLFYRLNILSVVIPPLRLRVNDALLLANYFLNKYQMQYGENDKCFNQSAIEWILEYSWPGNVRELENVVHRAFLISEANNIERHHICENNTDYAADEQLDRFDSVASFDVSFNDAKTLVIETFEKQYLSGLMEKFSGNVTLAAKKACKERRAFGKLLKKHGIDRVNFI